MEKRNDLSNDIYDVWECGCGTMTPVKKNSPKPYCEYCRRVNEYAQKDYIIDDAFFEEYQDELEDETMEIKTTEQIVEGWDSGREDENVWVNAKSLLAHCHKGRVIDNGKVDGYLFVLTEEQFNRLSEQEDTEEEIFDDFGDLDEDKLICYECNQEIPKDNKMEGYETIYRCKCGAYNSFH